MRIAIFSDTYAPDVNGVATHIKVLRDGLTELGHHVLVVTASTLYKHHTLKDGVLYCPSMKLKKLYGYGLASPLSKTRLDIVKKFNPDVIHTHQEFSMGLSAIRIANALDIPFVYTLHTMYDDYVYYFAPKIFIKPAKKIFYKYVGFFGKRASVITSPSTKATPFFVKCNVKKNVNVVPNSIEFEDFDENLADPLNVKKIREQYGIPSSATVAVFCGRLAAEKSVDVLMDTFKKHIDFEKLNLHLVIIGDGPAKDDLYEHAKKIGIDKYVTFTGRIEHKEIMPVYASGDLYVSASTTEMMSISMLEGMAAGLPVIQKYDKENAHQINEGVNGYNYKTGEEMAQRIEEICKMTPEEKNEMKKRVRESVAHAGPKDLAEFLLSIYQNAIDLKNIRKR